MVFGGVSPSRGSSGIFRVQDFAGRAEFTRFLRPRIREMVEMKAEVTVSSLGRVVRGVITEIYDDTVKGWAEIIIKGRQKGSEETRTYQIPMPDIYSIELHQQIAELPESPAFNKYQERSLVLSRKEFDRVMGHSVTEAERSIAASAFAQARFVPATGQLEMAAKMIGALDPARIPKVPGGLPNLYWLAAESENLLGLA